MDYMVREIYIANRIGEIKSISLIKRVIDILPQNTVQKLVGELDSTKVNFNKNTALVKLIQDRMEVGRVPRSDIIKITIWAREPDIAYTLANTVAAEFLNSHVETRRESAGGIATFLENQLEVYRERLFQAETAFTNFKEKNEISNLGKQSEGLVLQYTEAEVLYNITKAESGAQSRRLEVLQQKISQERNAVVPSLTNISSPRAEQLKNKLVELELQHTDLLLQNFSNDHPRLVQIRERIDATKENLTAEAVKLAKGEGLLDSFSHLRSYMEESLKLQIELESTKAKELELKKTLDSYDQMIREYPAKEIQLARLVREKRVSEDTYMMLIKKREQAKLSEAEAKSSLRILDQAEFPTIPYWPLKIVNIIVGTLLGGLFGIAIIFFTEHLQSVIESSEDIENVTAWSVVGVIPNSKHLRNGFKKKKNLRLPISSDNKHETTTRIIPSATSIEAEAYRILTRRIQLLSQKENTGVILVTSSGPQEGKSTTAVNLAVSLANMGQNTLLVDMDLRRPTIHKMFNTQISPGMFDLLQHMESVDNKIQDKKNKNLNSKNNSDSMPISFEMVSSIEDIFFNVIQTTGIKNLHLLSSGELEKDGISFLGSGHLGVTIELVSRFFDSVIIDGPPLLMVSEASILSSLADGVVYVLECGRTSKRAVVKSQEVLTMAKANILGVVMNKIRIGQMYSKNEYYHYNY